MNISFDKLEDIPLVFEKEPKKIRSLMPNGELKNCEFINNKGITRIKTIAETLSPVVLVSE